jgi:hypothetical protein
MNGFGTKYLRMRAALLCLLAAALLAFPPAAFAADAGDADEGYDDAPGVERDGDFVAMAYLFKDYTSMSWEIVDPGEYDGEEFELPAGLVSSLKVMPGYRITLYERPGFGGESAEFDGDTEDLREWSRRASSLKIERIREVDPDEAEAWVAAVRDAEDELGRFTFVKLEPDKLAEGIEKHRKTIEEFKDIHPFQWIEMTDGERDEWGGRLIAAFRDCGADVSGATPETFSSLMNNFLEFYGPNSGFTSLRAACCVFGIHDDVFYR